MNSAVIHMWVGDKIYKRINVALHVARLTSLSPIMDTYKWISNIESSIIYSIFYK